MDFLEEAVKAIGLTDKELDELEFMETDDVLSLIASNETERRSRL
jgi:hypothetical protein